MSPLGNHIRLRLKDDRTIATTPAHQRLVTLIVLEQGQQDSLLCTSLAGNHLHLDALCNAGQASRLVQRISSSVKQRLGLPVGFTHYPHEPIRDNRHLWYSVRYILTQRQHHGLPPEQPLEGTNLPDLLGLRISGNYTRENLRRWLPQLREARLMEWLGVDGLPLANGPIEGLHEATLAAAGLETLRGGSPPALCARRALAEVAGPQMSHPELADLLCIRPRTLTWLKRRPVDDALVRAIRLQLSARTLLQDRRVKWSAGATG